MDDNIEDKSVLDKENRFKYLIDRYRDIEKNLNDNKKKIIYSELYNMILLIIETLVYILFRGNSSIGLIIGLIINYIVFNAISIGFFGTRMGRNSERKKLFKEKLELEKQIAIVSKELEDIKDNIVYMVEDTNEVRGINNTLNESYMKDTSKVKVRRLVRNNDKNR